MKYVRSLFTDADKIIMFCSVLARVFGLLGAAGCVTEGHPYTSTMFLALAGAAMEIKDQVVKKQSGAVDGETKNPDV